MISIITSVFNGEATISDTIKSVQGQQLGNYEHLIIDGNSSDRTCEIVRKFSLNDRKIKLFSEDDDGIYDAWNKGVKKSKGEFIIFLSADDIFFQNALINIKNKLTDDNVDIFAFNIAMLDEASEFYKLIKRSTVPKHSIESPIILCMGLVFRKRTLLKLGLFDKKFKISGDYELIAKAISNNMNFKYYDKNLTIMREGGISSNFRFEHAKKIEQLKVYLRYENKISAKWIFNHFWKYIKVVITCKIMKNYFMKKKMNQSEFFDKEKIYWFKSN